jgi:GNAT superfamily N-acetyltransferase
MLADVTVWYLDMKRPDQLKPGRLPEREATLMRAEIPCPEWSRFLYNIVGAKWHWTDRHPWTHEQWRTWVEQAETWVAYVSGTPAGYFELARPSADEVNLAYFGLLPWAIGQGLGGWLLTRAVERAWALGPRIVTVNTCSLDGPHALANYRARGFEIARVIVYSRELGDGPAAQA